MDKGTGLGLATVYGIIKQNNGFINVYSEPDQGTTIKIYLPRQGAKADEISEDSTEKTPSGQGETILVVEDDRAILKFMERNLKELDYTVMTSTHPEKVMDMIRAHTGKIHLLITDVIMPKMNGRDLAQQLQSICPDMKCIYMSGYTADVITDKGVLDKGENFIQKPFSKKKLAELVRNVLDGN
jgi:CheY-like chemotaxis protein